MEGYNISFFTFGSTGSGKTHTFQGGRKEAGIVTLLVENLVADLLHKEQSVYNIYIYIYIYRLHHNTQDQRHTP